MRIVARIPGVDPNCLAFLKENGFEARQTRQSIIVEFPMQKRGFAGSPDIFYVPPFLLDLDLIFLINLAEGGGGRRKTGTATTVCGFSGKPLKPYLIPLGRNLANRDHAFFSVPGVAITVTAIRKSQLVVVKTHTIQQENLIAWIETEVLHAGKISQISRSLRRFCPAAKAALEKAECHHCIHPHFIAAGGR